MGETLKGTSLQILNLIKKNPGVTREELAKQTNLTVRGIEYQLNKLRQANLIERAGSTKAGFWKLK